MDEPQDGASQSESLDALAREADLLDTSPEREAAAGAMVAVEQATASASAELLGALQLVRGMVFPMLSAVIDKGRMAALEGVWHDGVLGASAEAGARIMAIHGWTLGGAFDKYGPYVALGVALVPPALATRAIMAPTPKEPKPAAPAGEGGGNAVA
jgi:hypothetical protein